MIQFFRSFFSSKIGIAVTLGFLALIAFAFASSDVANTGTFGGVSGGDRVAVVGKERVDASELSASITSTFNQVRQDNPTLSMQAFLAQGGLETVIGQLLQRTALAEFARQHGIRASNALVDSEILQIGAFRGPDGRFDQNAFRSALAQQGVSEAAVRDDLAQGLMIRQLMTPITFAPVMPASVGQRYASLLREQRDGALALIPAASFAPQGQPSAEQLQTFYREQSSRYIRPERRVIRFASFGDSALGNLPAPTPAQIQERYNRDRAQYSAVERRRFTQLIVPTQAAAQAIIAEVRGGKALDAAAREKGLATTQVAPVTQAELTARASAAVAQAAFAAQQGAIAEPARGGLGWYVLRIEGIERQAARTLAEAQAEISAALAADQRRAALSDLTARLEDEFAEGKTLAEVAQELGIQVTTTAPATADGRIYGRDETVPAVLGRALETAFAMDEGEPQLAEVVPGETFLIFDVASITPSAAAPLAEVREDVVRDWRNHQGMLAAKAAAERVREKVAGGTPLAQALAAENRSLPAPQTVSLNREELAQLGNVPSSLALFFSMAAGTVKTLESPAEGGWFVVKVDKIEAGTVAPNDPIVLATVRQLGAITGEEYIQQFVNAVQLEVGVERNDAAISAVAAQLSGQGN